MSDCPISSPSYADNLQIIKSAVKIAELERKLQQDIDAVELWAARKM